MTVSEVGWFSAGFHRGGYLPRYAGLIEHFELDARQRCAIFPRGSTPRLAWRWPWPPTRKC